MRAVYAAGTDARDPLSMLRVGDVAASATPEDWVGVRVRASALNRHDLWSLAGVGLGADDCPMILGCDASGVDADGNEVVVHAVVGDPVAGGGDETLDPHRTLLSERYPGTMASVVRVPRRNLVPKPPELSFAEAACLPTAWLTAYRMLVTRGRLPDGGSVLVQGAGGGVATAAISLAVALGARVYAVTEDPAKHHQVEALGAEPIVLGRRPPERVDVVVDSVGEPTVALSVKWAKSGGRVVSCGATAGHVATLDMRQIFFRQIELVGSTMGTRDELVALLGLLTATGTRPVIDSVWPFERAPEAFARLHDRKAFGKIVLDHEASSSDGRPSR